MFVYIVAIPGTATARRTRVLVPVACYGTIMHVCLSVCVPCYGVDPRMPVASASFYTCIAIPVQ